MFKNMKLGTKIFLGFILVLAFLCIVAFIGFNSLSKVVDRVDTAEDVNTIVKTLLETRKHEKNYIIRGDVTFKQMVDDGLTTIVKQAGVTRQKFNNKTNRDQMDQVVEKADAYLNAFDTYVDLDLQKAETMEKMRALAREALAEAEAIRADQKQKLEVEQQKDGGGGLIGDKLTKADDANRIIKWFLDTRKNEKEFIISKGDNRWMENVNANLTKIFDLANDLKTRFEKNNNVEQINGVISAIKAYEKTFDTFAELMKAQEATDADMVAAARGMGEVCMAAKSDQEQKMHSQISVARTFIIIGTMISIVVGLLFAGFITRAIAKPLHIIIHGMDEGANQVASASGQVASSSQSMAEGTSEQAASIEETSSSMEEMSSMTRKNSENAGQADILMQETNRIVSNANGSMEQLTGSMQEITKASEETSKIIKTIDEIAFQTNLLALNAAVEAARAGEAGAGFAVVADEVRNLAIRTSEAAKNTAQLIEGTVRKVKAGSKLVTTTNEAFSKVSESSSKVGNIISEIAEASKEQSHGIEQVNLAITEMDKVVQQNAANSEESAAASEELNAQAEQLKSYVGDLVMLVTGSRNQKNQGRTAGIHPQKPGVSSGVSGKLTEKTGKGKILPYNSKEVRSDQIIPFDDDGDFENF